MKGPIVPIRSTIILARGWWSTCAWLSRRIPHASFPGELPEILIAFCHYVFAVLCLIIKVHWVFAKAALAVFTHRPKSSFNGLNGLFICVREGVFLGTIWSVFFFKFSKGASFGWPLILLTPSDAPLTTPTLSPQQMGSVPWYPHSIFGRATGCCVGGGVEKIKYSCRKMNGHPWLKSVPIYSSRARLINPLTG